MEPSELDQTGVMTVDRNDGDASWPDSLRQLCHQVAGGAAGSENAAAALAKAMAEQDFPALGTRYRVTRKLGQGGMGAVFEGEDSQTGSRVAIKVLPPELTPDAQAMQRFHKEARLLSQVRHENVANLLDFGDHNGTCFLVMELVEGADLKSALLRAGTLSESMALSLASDIAAALSASHARGIVHRDIKPANILLSTFPEEGKSPAQAVIDAMGDDRPPTARLTDFGLARHVNQAASLEMTRTGVMLGTPYYISPEQCAGNREITPAADIYSLGATLFELLTGRPPFKTDDPVKLISMHCFEVAPDVRKLNPEISDATAALVAKSLQKSPLERYADAGHLLQELQRSLRGEATAAEAHPTLPAANGRVFEARWEWDLNGEARALWPLVSNTERINAAIGLPPVEYVTRRDAQGVMHRIGSFKLGWTRLQWEEHPFEWIEGKRLGVLREFENGPFEWFASVVELTAKPEGGSRLTHNVRIATRGLLGRLIAHIEVNWKGSKPLDRVYRRIDDSVCGRLSGSSVIDPFLATKSLTDPQRKKLNALRERLCGQNYDPVAMERLEEFLADSPAVELARIRPRSVARRLRVDPDQLTAACLEACHSGVLELHWDILCPTCRVASNVKETLEEIDRHAHCEACENDFDVDFASSVELIFRAHPEFRSADLKTYCIGGPEHAPHVVAQAKLVAGETLEWDLSLDPGAYIVRGPQLPFTISLIAEPGMGPSRHHIALSPAKTSKSSMRLSSGRRLIALENKYSHSLVVRLERVVSRNDAITAEQATQLPVFKRLFPSQAITRDRLSDVSTCTLLALRVTNMLELFGILGDSLTMERVRCALESYRRQIEAQGGTLLKEQDDRLLASFPHALAAMRTGIELYESVVPSNSAEQPRLRIALHRGITMSTTMNGRLDYFGRSVSQTNGLLDHDSTSSFLVSDELAEDEVCLDCLRDAGWMLKQHSIVSGLTSYVAVQPDAQAKKQNPRSATDPRRRNTPFAYPENHDETDQ